MVGHHATRAAHKVPQAFRTYTPKHSPQHLVVPLEPVKVPPGGLVQGRLVVRRAADVLEHVRQVVELLVTLDDAVALFGLPSGWATSSPPAW